METPITKFLQGVLVKSERILTLIKRDIWSCVVINKLSVASLRIQLNTEHKNTNRCVLETSESYILICILYIYMTGDISVTGTADHWGASVFTQWHLVRFLLLNVHFFLCQTLICLFVSFLLVIILWRLDETTWDKVTIQNTSI